QHELPQPGTLTKRETDERERADIEYGLGVAHEIARLDLGQTIVVRDRAGELVRGRLTVVKTAKPDQDMRFDVPVVGVPTIETMIRSGATCICLTAGKTLMFDREEMIRQANKNRISIVAA